MSIQYDNYLHQHKSNVLIGFHWLKKNLPEIIKAAGSVDLEWQIGYNHDASKTEPEEYAAYDAYFYGNRSYAVVQDFRKAWLHHVHHNPHHWQHWILINDEPNEAEIVIEMPYNYVIEMICDWWAFSWSKGNLKEIRTWYNEHKDYMKLHPNTRKTVEKIIEQICEKVDYSEIKESD